MTTTRQDAWTKDEDVLLAEVVLRHIREGGTQLQAFEEVGKKLSRTPAACGFRWNSLVRKQYKSGIELAKKQRKELKKQKSLITKNSRFEENRVNQTEDGDLNPIRNIIISLEHLEKQWLERSQHADLHKRVSLLENENQALKKERDHWLSEYRALLGVMEKARKLVYLEEEVVKKKAKNGRGS
ncbi:MAG TPA: RsfA family transcriptional regulator [Bacillus sp. (in: firmicutes)]|uniref:RsfA family transcriptional regulator n=1 Tax=Bacillus litorisediminis TaxID=2922713 RepID=UPI001FAC002A|nr:RsfA family transcriptional regulator [Bacillus litorisediminis]HWO77429.1 RsfA family transcriptional regulator [Bacillus sp. (in: firmicutes)]